MRGRASTARQPMPQAGSSTTVEAPLPLQLALTWLVVALYTTNGQENQVHSATFMSAILEIIMAEILELGESPITFEALRYKTDALLRVEANSVARSNQKLSARGQVVSDERLDSARFSSWMDRFFGSVEEGCACLDLLESDARDQINETDEEALSDDPEPVERHSILGVFLRRVVVHVRKMSFEETSQLVRQIGQWCRGSEGDTWIHASSLNRRLAMDDNLDKRTAAMQEFQAASTNGDYSKALASLRRFYDYQQPIPGRGQHQHALLNLANFYYTTGGMDSAKVTIDEAIKKARAEGDKACLQACMSLLTRINAETDGTAFGHLEPTRASSSAVPESRLPEPSTPMDDLWSVKAAADMGEAAHVAFRRIHRALARHEHIPSKHSNKDTRDSWASRHEFDVAAWHSAQAGLWDMMGSDVLAELHDDLVDEHITSGTDSRLTVILSRAARATRRAEWDEALMLLIATSTFEGLSIDEYHRWSRAVWAIFEARSTMTEDSEALAIIESMRPASELARRLGPGGNVRELGNSEDAPPRDGLLFAHDEVRDLLRKTRKLLKADTPPHVMLPHILSAIHLSSQLSLWPLYREATVLLCLVMLNMEGAELAEKTKTELSMVRDQVLGSQDEELICLMETALGEAELEIELAKADRRDDFELAQRQLRSALSRATRIGSRELVERLTSTLALLAHIEDDEVNKDEMTELWAKQQTGNAEQLADQREQIKQFGRMVRMVGLRVAKGWR